MDFEITVTCQHGQDFRVTGEVENESYSWVEADPIINPDDDPYEPCGCNQSTLTQLGINKHDADFRYARETYGT